MRRKVGEKLFAGEVADRDDVWHIGAQMLVYFHEPATVRGDARRLQPQSGRVWPTADANHHVLGRDASLLTVLQLNDSGLLVIVGVQNLQQLCASVYGDA